LTLIPDLYHHITKTINGSVTLGNANPPNENKAKLRVQWYRCPIEPAKLRELTKRSDLKGFLFVAGQLVLFAATAYLAHYFFVRQNWIGVVVALWVHGTIRGVCSSGSHEFSHGTVFKTKSLNALFVRVWGVLGWHNFHHYKMSHTYHHLYTLHPDGDGEVVLPGNFSLKPLRLLQIFTFDLTFFVNWVFPLARTALTGRFRDDWSKRIFTPEQAKPLKRAVRWTRFLITFHVAVAVVSAIFGYWMIPATLSLGVFTGRWWIYFIGATMHAGLRDNVSDFRLCTRTIKLDPLSGYLRWNMHYHIEHHMFAAVPCYNLGRLYRAVAQDMPKRRTIFEAWREMRDAEKRQRTDPTYQFDTPLPDSRSDQIEHDPLGAAIGDIRPRDFVEPSSAP
jgi:fatty acid desaturase